MASSRDVGEFSDGYAYQSGPTQLFKLIPKYPLVGDSDGGALLFTVVVFEISLLLLCCCG